MGLTFEHLEERSFELVVLDDGVLEEVHALE